MIRVLHLTDSWGPGGAETIFACLASGIGAPQFESLSGVPRASGWLYDTLRERGIEPIILPNSGPFDLAHLGRVVRTIQRCRIDLIQAHTIGTGVYAAVAGFISRIPVVCTLHGRIDLALDDRYRAAKFRILSTSGAILVPVSQSLRAELLSTTPVTEDHAPVIYNGVDVERFRPGRNSRLRSELAIGDHEIVIGAVGNVRPVKGYEVLLDAAARLKDRGHSFRIVIVGQTIGEPFAEIERRRAELGLTDKVLFAGFSDRPEDFYRLFDIYVLTSHSEGFPLSTLQALAAGLPIVATRCGGPEEMLSDGNTGLLAEKGSGRDVADKLEMLIANETLRRQMGAAARDQAEKSYSTDVMLREYSRLYQNLASHEPSNPQ